MTGKPLVARFHLFEFGLLVAITATAFYKIPAGTDLPVHWGFNGRPDQIWPRDPALLVFPVVALLLIGLFAAIGWFARPERIDPGRTVSETMLAVLLGLLCALQFALILVGVGSDIDMIRIVVFGMAALLLALGVGLWNVPPNAYAGVRLPWTMKNKANWVATHRLTGALVLLGGVGLGIVAWLKPDPASMLEALPLAIFVPLLVGGIFSFVRSKF